MRKILIAAAAVAAVSTPALAQQSGLVNVNVTDISVLNNFLNDTQIAALNNLNVPISVQVPVGVAANVCDVSANVLAHQKKGGTATCTAKSGSKALANAVAAQKLNQKK
jgi:hypothetical protein